MNWDRVKISDCVSKVSTVNPSLVYNENLFKYVDIASIDNKTKTIGEVQSITGISAPSRARQVLEEGDILVSTVRPNLNAVALVTNELNGAIGSTGFCVLRPINNTLHPKYLFYWVRSRSFISEMERKATGASYPAVSDSIIKNSEIPLPPINIQQQIADTLDKADALRRKDQELLDKYDELAQAVFYEMFGDISINSKNWNIVQIRLIAQEVKYGTSSPAAASGSYPYLRMNNISYSGELLLDDLKYISASEKEYEKYGTRYGDLLFNRTNSKDLVGKTTIVDTETPMIIAGYLIRIRFNDQANPWYVSTFMNSTHMKKVLRNKCKSIIGMANINAQELQDFNIPLPPKELQDLFADKLTHIKKQQLIVKKTQSKSSAYFDQCLYNYFV